MKKTIVILATVSFLLFSVVLNSSAVDRSKEPGDLVLALITAPVTIPLLGLAFVFHYPFLSINEKIKISKLRKNYIDKVKDYELLFEDFIKNECSIEYYENYVKNKIDYHELSNLTNSYDSHLRYRMPDKLWFYKARKKEILTQKTFNPVTDYQRFWEEKTLGILSKDDHTLCIKMLSGSKFKYLVRPECREFVDACTLAIGTIFNLKIFEHVIK